MNIRSGHLWRDLPGERAVDREVLDGFTRRAVGIDTEARRDSNLALGRLVLSTFFPPPSGAVNSEELWLHRRRRHRTFQALRAPVEGRPSWSHLNECVRVLLQHDWLTAEGQKLAFSHLKALLRMPDGRAKRELACRAVAEGWSERRLKAAVAELVVPKRTRSAARVEHHARLASLTAALDSALAELRALEVEGASLLSGEEHTRLLERARALHSVLGRLLPPPGKHLTFRVVSPTTPQTASGLFLRRDKTSPLPNPERRPRARTRQRRPAEAARGGPGRSELSGSSC